MSCDREAARQEEEEGRAALSSGPKNGSEGDRGRVPVGKRVEVSVLREVVKRESENRTESKSAKAAQRTVLPPRETKSKKETRTVDVGKTVGAGVEVKKTVERVVVQEGVIGKEVNEEPRTEETAVPVEETVVPEEAVNKVTVGVESAVVENDAAQEEKAEEPVFETPVPNGTDESSSVESMGASTEELKQKEYQRLFTDEELDAMEVSSPGQEGTVLAGQDLAVEKEEYDKELEDRLFPLDEVELLKRMKKNAEAQKEPSLEDMAKHLNLPVEVLERTKEASPDEMSSPEYWQEWFQSTLESSEEAKRANRDFKAFGPRSMQGVPGASEVVYEDFGMLKKIINDEEVRLEQRKKAAALITEADVVASISVPLDSGNDAALLVSPETINEEIYPSVVRSIARLTVYEMLKDNKNGELGTDVLEERKPDREEAIKKPPMRDKMPLVDWEQFRRQGAVLLRSWRSQAATRTVSLNGPNNTTLRTLRASGTSCGIARAELGRHTLVDESVETGRGCALTVLHCMSTVPKLWVAWR
ncbi:hypothetical protein PF005_g21632 [Phytophthora fragariae]|uniref:Uncharacterized protein n=1 Tax=Phytophthora fragariae TaxID=53985 RepID=A0A6A3WG56_9STRA|nr:hypothetical protein PF005_g21632 [Phytophthora fragariae]